MLNIHIHLGSIEELLAEDTTGVVAENPELEENTGHSFDVGQAVSEVGGEELGGADEEQSRGEDLSSVEAEMGVFDITNQMPSSLPAVNSTLSETGR